MERTMQSVLGQFEDYSAMFIHCARCPPRSFAILSDGNRKLGLSSFNQAQGTQFTAVRVKRNNHCFDIAMIAESCTGQD